MPLTVHHLIWEHWPILLCSRGGRISSALRACCKNSPTPFVKQSSEILVSTRYVCDCLEFWDARSRRGVKTNCLYSREIVSTLMGPGAVSRFTLIWPWSQLVWGAGNHKNRDFLRSFLCRNEAGERHGLRFSRQRVGVNVGNIQYARVKSKIFRHFFVYVYTVYGVNNFRQ